MNRGVLKRFQRDENGVAAVEFILVAPILLLLLLGSFEIMHALMAHKKVQKVTYTVDHLLTKAPNINKQTVQDTLRASSYLLVPFKGQPAIDVFYQYTNATGTVTERWTQGRRAAGDEALLAQPLPSGYGALRDTGFLMTYGRYTHRAVFPTLFFEEYEMRAESTVRPRPGASLSCADC